MREKSMGKKTVVRVIHVLHAAGGLKDFHFSVPREILLRILLQR